MGHKGKFGHEFLEFEFQPDGKLRYANHTNYKRDSMIRKETYISRAVMEELRRIILDSEVMKEDDKLWPPPDRDGKQELEIIYNGEHICFSVPHQPTNACLFCGRPPRSGRSSMCRRARTRKACGSSTTWCRT